MSMLPRLKPEKFYDLVIEVAIVRPGPIQGVMVHPYLAASGRGGRRLPCQLEAVLGDTRRAAVSGTGDEDRDGRRGFTPAEADKLRRAMATFRRVGTIQTLQAKMVAG